MRTLCSVVYLFVLSFACSLWAESQTSVRLGNDTEAPPQRVALLIGNSNYQNVHSLKNPKNDVDQLAAKLRQVGFQTTVTYDLNHDDFIKALSVFQNKLEPGGIALFYYSGHGVQLRGNSYLLPINIEANPNAVSLEGIGISLASVRGALDSARLSLIILDACRTSLNLQTKGQLQGLAPFFSKGALVAYAADEGQAASDNDNESVSLFTKHLIRELDKPDETLCPLFDAVRAAVDEASGHVQFPFIYDGVIGDFVFNRKTTAEYRKLSGLGTAALWTAIQRSDNPNDFAAFLSPRFPNKEHSKEAEDRLSSLMSSTVKAVGVAPLDAQAPPGLLALANQGQRLFYERAYPKACEVFAKLLQSRPSDGAVIYDYATCLLQLGKNDEAIQLFSKAIEARPEWPWSRFNRGVAFHLKGNLNDAIQDYAWTLERRPDTALGYNNLAVAKRQAGDVAGAEQAVTKAVSLDSAYAPAFFNGAKIFVGVGRAANADAYQKTGNTLTIPF